MLLRQIIFAALVIGIITGGAYSLLQGWRILPLIHQAEALEGGGPGASGAAGQSASPARGHAQGHGGHEGHHAHQVHGGHHGHEGHHGGAGWAPADGWERLSWTLFSNILAAVGYAALLLAAMAWAKDAGLSAGSAWTGLLWGLGGFATFCAAPALGLAPELPGSQAASLEARQIWWLATAACTAGGLLTFVLAPGYLKAAGLAPLLAPHLWGAPLLGDGPFAHRAPEVAETLRALHQQFIVDTVWVNASFWLLLGVFCHWYLNHRIRMNDVAR